MILTVRTLSTWQKLRFSPHMNISCRYFKGAFHKSIFSFQIVRWASKWFVAALFSFKPLNIVDGKIIQRVKPLLDFNWRRSRLRCKICNSFEFPLFELTATPKKKHKKKENCFVSIVFFTCVNLPWNIQVDLSGTVSEKAPHISFARIVFDWARGHINRMEFFQRAALKSPPWSGLELGAH